MPDAPQTDDTENGVIRRLRRKILFGLLWTSPVFLYVGSYLSLSLHGRFEPAAIGTNGVKWYHWAPKGFVTDFKWNEKLTYAYFPLYFLDIRFWHTSDDAVRGRYPINEVAIEDIGKVYRAWK